MVKILCDKCGKPLVEPIFRVIITDGTMTKEAQFCDEHAQRLHDSLMRYASYKEADDVESGMALD